jgi:nucleotide-binding universal stress UspA family protein
MVLPSQARAALRKELDAKYYEHQGHGIMGPVHNFQEPHGIKAKGIWKTGNAGELIAKLAETEKFGLVVMGSHGRGALGNLVVGSVTTKVLASCKVPVLIVR